MKYLRKPKVSVKRRNELSARGANEIFEARSSGFFFMNKLKLDRAHSKKILLATSALFLISAGSVFAQATMYNDQYKIRSGNLNSISGESSGSGFNLNITSGQTGVGLYSGTNYTVRAGFQYISSIIPFSFAISSQLIDFGTLSPTNPVSRTNTLTINNQSAYGYVVTASENHQLLVPSNGGIIPDTTCDAGTCSETTASAWTSSLVYGFGYRCDSVSVINNGVTSTGCVAGDNTFYSNPTYYKQFADASKSEVNQSVMAGTSSLSRTVANQQATITYKTNISSSQTAGLYTNSITYIATPTY